MCSPAIALIECHTALSAQREASNCGMLAVISQAQINCYALHLIRCRPLLCSWTPNKIHDIAGLHLARCVPQHRLRLCECRHQGDLQAERTQLVIICVRCAQCGVIDRSPDTSSPGVCGHRSPRDHQGVERALSKRRS